MAELCRPIGATTTCCSVCYAPTTAYVAADYGHALAEQRSQPTAQQAAQKFADQFRHDYSDGGPRWQVSTFQEAAATARQRFKFLMVYLHSPSHQVASQDISCLTA